MPDKERSAEQESADEKYTIVLECVSLNETELAEYRSSRGVIANQVKQWKPV